MSDQSEKSKQKEVSPLDSKVREASEFETKEAGLHNQENKKIHDQTQAKHKIEHSATDLMGLQTNRETMGLEDRKKGIVYTGAGLVPMVPDDSTRSYAEKLKAIKPVKTEAELEERKGAATLSWMKEKGLIASTPPNFMSALTPQMRADVIAAFQKGGQVGERSINETAEDILRKTAQGHIDAIKFPIDLVIAAGKGLWAILEFEHDLMFDPERALKTAETAGDNIGKALVVGIELWAGGSKYVSDVQKTGDYKKPFQTLGVAINNWYDGLTPGDQMHAMAIISTGFGMGAAAGELRRLSKPGAFVEFIQEATQALPKNPEAQAKAAESIKKLIEIFSRSYVGKLRTAGGPAIDVADDMLYMERRAYKSPKTGRELTPGKAAEEAGFDKQTFQKLGPLEKVEQLIKKGFKLIEPKQYHIDGCEKPLSEAAMAKHLKIEKDGLRAMTSEQLEAKGITVIEPVNGRLPINWEWAGKNYPFAEKHPEIFNMLQKEYPEFAEKLKDGIKFTKDGYPEFKPFSLRKFSFKHPFQTREKDFFEADKNFWPDIKTAAEGEARRRALGLTWHHMEPRPGEPPTMFLLPTILHDSVKHSGGIAAKIGNQLKITNQSR
ncbi:MAG: HNH endonuclease [Cyanobacteria bacterium TGS_CYA1]|nr:HNH endonuclease [Cyanobacteria bacterium TGS_CYA1]